MSAIRLARGFTGRDKIIKFEGCYHGHADSLLVKAGSGMLTLGVPTSPGVPAELAAHTITLPYNDAAQVRAAFAEIGARRRLRDRRAGGRQHELHPAGARLPRGAARRMHEARRGADLRRGDDRLPRRARRRAGALRHQARPHDARQDHRRRHAGRRLRRPPRHHGVHRAARPGVSGRHAVGQPGRDGRGPRHARRPVGTGLPRQARRKDRPPRARHPGRGAARPACRSPPTTSAACSDCSSPTRRT